MELRIAVDGHATDVDAVWDWLRSESLFRGRTRLVPAPVAVGTMGGSTELVIEAAAALAGASALWNAVARSLSMYFSQRRRELTIELTDSDGRRIRVTGTELKDPQGVVREVMANASRRTER